MRISHSLVWVLLSMGLVLGVFLEYIGLPLTFGVDCQYVYFTLWWSNVILLVFSTACFLIISCIQTNIVRFQRNILTFIFISILSVVYLFLIMYASMENRTTPVLQSVLGSCPFIYSIAMTICCIPSKETLNYCTIRPIISLILFLSGISIMFIGVLVTQSKGVTSSSQTILWSYLYIFGTIPLAAAAVLQERYLKARSSDPFSSFSYNIISMLFFCTLFKVLFIAILFALDFTPWFGCSLDISQFWNNQETTLQEIFSGERGWWSFLLFNIGNLLGTTCHAAINSDSASFGFMLITLASPLSTIFWSLYSPSYLPSMAPSAEQIIWGVCSALCLISGSVLWKLWESKERVKGIINNQL